MALICMQDALQDVSLVSQRIKARSDVKRGEEACLIRGREWRGGGGKMKQTAEDGCNGQIFSITAKILSLTCIACQIN